MNLYYKPLLFGLILLLTCVESVCADAFDCTGPLRADERSKLLAGIEAAYKRVDDLKATFVHFLSSANA